MNHRLSLLVVVAVALTPLGLLAEGSAWGEWQPETFRRLVGFVPEGIRTALALPAPLADYAVPGLGPVAGYLLSATIGVLLLYAGLRLLRR